MLNFFLGLIGSLSVISMVINYFCEVYFFHPTIVRINFILTYVVCIISLAFIYAYGENKDMLKIAILVFVISLIKSLLYYRNYINIVMDYKNEQNNIEKENENKED